jgi:cytochrome c oxidase assembly protein subunit 15
MSSRTNEPVTPDGAERAVRLCARWFLGVGLLTLGQMVLGAMVRAHDAGLACPDWPRCFGVWLPEMDFEIAHEVGHRAVAGLVSLGLLMGTLLVTLRTPFARGRMGWLLALAWTLLGVQVVLGGLTVLLRLEPWTVTAHLLMGSAFCAIVMWIAWDLAEQTRPRLPRSPASDRAFALVLAAAAVLVAQVTLGGIVSSHGAGLACASFPTCDGASIAPSFAGLVGIQVMHRLNAVLLLLALGALVWTLRASPRQYALAWLALRLSVLQAGLGAMNVLLRLPVEVTALHSAAAAALVLILARLLREVIYSRAGASVGREPRRAATPVPLSSST